jgi:hypothetical protein
MTARRFLSVYYRHAGRLERMLAGKPPTHAEAIEDQRRARAEEER